MASFETKNPNLGKFWRVLQWEILVYFYVHLVYFTVIWSILRPFGLFYGHLVYCIVIWSISRPFGIFHGYLVYFPRFGMLHQENSGNPGARRRRCVSVGGTASAATAKLNGKENFRDNRNQEKMVHAHHIKFVKLRFECNNCLGSML
jgi:hypothetical protein